MEAIVAVKLSGDLRDSGEFLPAGEVTPADLDASVLFEDRALKPFHEALGPGICRSSLGVWRILDRLCRPPSGCRCRGRARQRTSPGLLLPRCGASAHTAGARSAFPSVRSPGQPTRSCHAPDPQRSKRWTRQWALCSLTAVRKVGRAIDLGIFCAKARDINKNNCLWSSFIFGALG